MKYRNRLQLLPLLISAIVAISLSLPSSANAAQTLTLIAEDSFDYTGNIVGKSGGTGFLNAWSDAYSGSNYSVQTPGLNYSGLTTSGGYIYSCSATPNQVCGVSRQIPTQSSGITYIQFLVHFGTQYGSGTPNMRFNNAVGGRVGGIGYGDGGISPAISILNADLRPMSDGTSSSGTLNAQNLVILRIDYSAIKSTMYINPNLTTFSYINPPTPDATYSNFAPEIKTIEFFARSGVKYDELKIYKVTGTSAEEDRAAEDSERRKREEDRRKAIAVAREKLNSALVANTPISAQDLADAESPIKSVDSLYLAYKELLSIKYALTKPLSLDEAYALKFNSFMKYAIYERMTGISTGEVTGRDLVRYGVIPMNTPMKQLTSYRLMKQPLAARNSIEKVDSFFKESSAKFLARKEHLAAVIKKIQSR